MVPPTEATYLVFQHDAKLLSFFVTIVKAVHLFADLDHAKQELFKSSDAEAYVVVTNGTIFHPQGGGQPSDEGEMISVSSEASSESGARFSVSSVRMDPSTGQVLHLGSFSGEAFRPHDKVTQHVDADKRLLYSRLHTAGHVLGAAVRHLLEKEVAGFDELKASHFPGTAACEFKGLIEGKWLAPVQERVDEYVARAMPVEIDFWDDADFRREGLERLIPPGQAPAADGGKWRVVKIVGAEVYPCGGTHVETTDLCGKTKVKKIARSKGVSRVSYTVE